MLLSYNLPPPIITASYFVLSSTEGEDDAEGAAEVRMLLDPSPLNNGAAKSAHLVLSDEVHK